MSRIHSSKMTSGPAERIISTIIAALIFVTINCSCSAFVPSTSFRVLNLETERTTSMARITRMTTTTITREGSAWIHPILRQSMLEENDSSMKKEEEGVKVGTSEYYAGFVGRSLDEEPISRVSGDAILGPTFKFIGGATAIIAVLLIGFLASNGLI